MSNEPDDVRLAVLHERTRILAICHEAKLKNGFKTPLSTSEEEFTGRVLANVIDAIHNKTAYEKIDVKLRAKTKG